MSDAKQGETFVVAGQLRWGAGDTLAEAKRNFTGQGGRLSAGYEILRFDAQTTVQGVDQMGSVHYVGNPPEQTVVPPRGR